MELLILGVALIAIGLLLNKILDRRDSRWSNVVLVIFEVIGIICIGVFAFL